MWRLETLALRLYALLASMSILVYRHRAKILLAVLLLVIILWRIDSQTARYSSKQVYTYYLPTVMRPVGLAGKGIASWTAGKYQAELGAAWFYTWSFCDAPGCVPMSRDWSLPPKCPELLLAGNEPNSIEPYGAPTTPQDAAAKSQAIRAACPSTLIIAGNVALPEFLGQTGIEWTRQYIDAGGQYDQLGIHAYASPNGNSAQVIGYLEDFVAAFPKERICVTESGTFNNSAETFGELMQYLTTHFDCLAVYTDQDPVGTPYATGMSLVDATGALTEYGIIYAGE
jgi:hypothetical protein